MPLGEAEGLAGSDAIGPISREKKPKARSEAAARPSETGSRKTVRSVIGPAGLRLQQDGKAKAEADEKNGDEHGVFEREGDGRPEQAVVPDRNVVLGEIDAAGLAQQRPAGDRHAGDEQQRGHEETRR